MAGVTIRYARAFADVVFSMKLDAAKVTAELQSIIAVVNGSLELRRVWENPAVPSEQKLKLLDAIASRAEISKPTRNFIAVLIDHRRLGMLPVIAKQFEHELNERMGLAEAEVTSARELSADERHDLEAQIQKVTGKKVRAHYATDQSLLGGAMVRLGSTIYDGSVRGQLQKIKEQLSS